LSVVWILTWIGQCLALGALTSALVRVAGRRVSALARSAAWTVALVLMAGLAVWPLLPPSSVASFVLSAADSRSAPTPAAIPPVVLPAMPAWVPATGAAVWAFGSPVWMGLAVRDVRRVGEPDPSFRREYDSQPPPLNAVALPVVGVPGVIVADRAAASGSSTSAQNTPWWGRAAALGAATGEGAATAGRATASFVKRMGTRVPQPFTR
jgi:hypothetical protein